MKRNVIGESAVNGTWLDLTRLSTMLVLKFFVLETEYIEYLWEEINHYRIHVKRKIRCDQNTSVIQLNI